MERQRLIDDIRTLAANYRWSWHPPTQELFATAGGEDFEAKQRNPWSWLVTVGDAAAVAAVESAGLAKRCGELVADLDAYMSAPSSSEPAVAYFCMEFGMHESFPIYSGGLGILAGDHVKTASDLRLDFVALGMLYPDGYLAQGVDAEGRQVSASAGLVRSDHALTKLSYTVTVGTPEGPLHADVWELQVGRTRLFLLDPDVERNEVPALRNLCRRLYGGDRTTRIRQELLLGIGGMRLLIDLELSNRVLHLNEGHCAFALAEAVRSLAVDGELNDAAETVTARTVFTTHTPVPAGHDRFSPTLARQHLMAAFEDDEALVAWIQRKSAEAGATAGSVCMTVLALNLSARCNGVSAIHGRVSGDMWDGYPIGHVTNGVHLGTWVSPLILERRPGELGAVRRRLRSRLVTFVRRRLEAMPKASRTGTPDALRDDILTIGFARRFAPYKRATLLLADTEQLASLLLDPERPVQILYAGKAHPADRSGQELMRLIIEAARNPVFGGRIHFVPNYDIHVGRLMVQGCDVWLNTPRRPLEASGTSGQKAAMNGCLNLSVGDGWWPEGYDGHNGWIVGPDTGSVAPAYQDAEDVTSVFELLSDQVIPLFYDREGPDSPGWLAAVDRSIETITPKFSSARMLSDYIEGYYRPAAGLEV